MAGARILIADDDPDLRDILRSILEGAGFTVVERDNGEAALQTIRSEPVDIAILDYMMPGLTGPQICEQLKQDLLLRHLPVIMLTGKSEVQDKVHGITSGADDYLLKPFEPQELLARVAMVMRRRAIDLDANPLTRLPGNVSIQRELERRIANGEPLAVCYIDLDRFKAFNDHYGFKRGDDVIKQTADVLLRCAKSGGDGRDFVGHIGGDDFIVMTTVERSERLCEAIIAAFDAMAPQLYDAADRAQGYLLHTDRKGQAVKVPMLSVSIALVSNAVQPLTHPGQIATIGAELKAYAKQFDRSIYVKERRQTG
jgi:diguanylate cyclase (GGDEF)-like protein